MTESKNVGKDLGKVRKEVRRNLSRIKLNYPYSQRTVDNVNIYNTYRKEFDLTEGTTASLNINIDEMPTPCSVNPPEIDSYINTTWSGDYVAGGCGDFSEEGSLRNWHCIGIGSTTGDYSVETITSPLLSSSNIYLPYDGCYLIEASWGSIGLSYFDNGTIELSVLKGGAGTILAASMTSTGVIAILGPSIYYTPSPSRLIGMVEAKAGDSISLYASASGFNKCKGWYGTNLRGGFQLHPASLKVTLIAVAEDVLTEREKNDLLPLPEGVTDPRMTDRIKCAWGDKTLRILNQTVEFYNNLTSKGELPYPNESWTAEEQWSHYFAAVWYGVGWTQLSDTHPMPAPETIAELLAYQTEWSAFMATCPEILDEYNRQCLVYNLINEQLKRLQDHYYATNGLGLPFYLYIEGSTEPKIFTTWTEFWAWVWDRGYNMETRFYDGDYIWTEAANTLEGLTPWPPPTTIGELEVYVAFYYTSYYSSGCV